MNFRIYDKSRGIISVLDKLFEVSKIHCISKLPDMTIELQHFEGYILTLLIKKMYKKPLEQEGKLAFVFEGFKTNPSSIFDQTLCKVSISEKGLEDLTNWVDLQRNYFDFDHIKPAQYHGLNNRELLILIMITLVKKISGGSKRNWKSLNAAFDIMVLIYRLRTCEEYFVCSSDSKFRVIQKVIFFNGKESFFVMPLLIPLTLHGKTFEPIAKLNSTYKENLKTRRYSKEELQAIVNSLPHSSKEDMGSAFDLLQGVIVT